MKYIVKHPDLDAYLSFDENFGFVYSEDVRNAVIMSYEVTLLFGGNIKRIIVWEQWVVVSSIISLIVVILGLWSRV